MEQQLKDAPILLKVIAQDFCDICEGFGIEPVITRVTDAVEGESGVHLDHRAFDVRDEFQGEFTFSEAERLMVLKALNSKFARNDGKETVIWHSFGGGPHHFHVQIAALTKTYMNVKHKKKEA
jgi:sulfur relay (sulfurtransferase) DsrC/TusE family protein